MHGVGPQGPARLEQAGQGPFHPRLAVACRQVQDPQVLLGRPLRLPLGQQVVSHAEAAGGEQVGLVAVVGKGPRLADQPVDDVPVVDAVLAPPPQPRQLLHPLLGVPQLDSLGVQAGLDPLADQPAGDGVDVALHPHGAARLHPQPQPLARLQAAWRQRPQHGPLLGQAGLTAVVELSEQLLQEGGVGVAAREVPAAPQHQGLVQGLLEAVVPLLHVPVLVALAGPNGLAPQAVVAQQGLVPPLEDVRVGPRLHRRRQPVGAVQLGHAAQLPQGVLQALAEALVALREADGAGLPVGVGQHEVVDQVREGNAGQGDAQLRAVREVRGGQPPGVVDLGEEDFLGRAPLRPPLPQPTLQRPQLAVGEASGVLPLQGPEEGLGLQAGVVGQLLGDPGPDLREGVRACPPGVLHAYLARQLARLPVPPCRLAIHAGPGSGQRQRSPLVQGLAEQADLLVGDHRDSFPAEETDGIQPSMCRGVLIVASQARWGVLIVVTGEV